MGLLRGLRSQVRWVLDSFIQNSATSCIAFESRGKPASEPGKKTIERRVEIQNMIEHSF